MSQNLEKLILAEQEKINAYQLKKDEFDKKSKDLGTKIKTCQDKIDKYTLTKNAEMYSAFTTNLVATGISFEDVLNALKNGDMLTLQEKLEESNKTANAVQPSQE